MSNTIASYIFALQRWLPLLTAHVFIRVIVSSIMVPILSVGLTITLMASDQSALTDQDIAKFLFTPAGAIGAVILISLLLVAIVLDVVIATVIIRQNARKPMTSLRLAAEFALYSARRLLPFMASFVLRVLVIVLPFAAIAGAVAFVFLTEYDINYYLSERPPDFLRGAALIGAVLLVAAVILFRTLSGWALALHLTLFENDMTFAPFKESQRLMDGYRVALIYRLIAWIAIRLIAGGILGGAVALVVTRIADWQPDSLRIVAMALLAGSLLYFIFNALISAVSNGALAMILNTEFNRVSAQDPNNALPSGTSVSPVATRVILGATLVFAVLSFGTGGVFIARMNHTAEADIIAHRGAAALAPENTMASVLQGLEDGADWIEIDVQENADGDVIVAHDSDFMKSARVPTKVWDITNEELSTMDVGSWYDESFSQERVPLLRDVLLAAKDRAGVIIELKYYGHDEELEHRVIAIVEETGMADQISTMSLKYPAVQKMRQLRPDWRTGVLAATFIGNISNLEGDFVALNQAQIKTRTVQRAQEAGKDVYAWTVNDALSISRMLWLGVDGLITDDPAFARETISAYNELTLFERVILAFGDGVDVTLDPEAEEDLRP